MATVLIVDDAADTRLLVRTLLTHAGHHVIEAGDGSTGLSSAIANTPDLVLLDLSLPLTSGAEFVRALRADPRTRTTAVVLYTGAEMSPALCDFMEMYGIRLSIPKPSEPGAFLQAVERALIS